METTPPNWSQTAEGPALQHLMRRLAACPSAFLATPTSAVGVGDVSVPAVISDLLNDLGGPPLGLDESHRFYTPADASKRQQQLQRARAALVTAWLLHDEWFRRHAASRAAGQVAEQARVLLCTGLDDASSLVNHERWVTDSDRREELVRHTLLGLQLRPQGESVEVAADRYTTLSSAERARVIAQAKANEERQRKIREELEAKKAAEAASSYSYE